MIDLFEYSKKIPVGCSTQIGPIHIRSEPSFIEICLKNKLLFGDDKVVIFQARKDIKWYILFDNRNSFDVMNIDYDKNWKQWEMDINGYFISVVDFIKKILEKNNTSYTITPNKTIINSSVRLGETNFICPEKNENVYKIINEEMNINIVIHEDLYKQRKYAYILGERIKIPNTEKWNEEDWLLWWMSN